jgi:hypothetical protein
MKDSSHTQIKSEIDKIVKNIDAILKKVENLDLNSDSSTDSGENTSK